MSKLSVSISYILNQGRNEVRWCPGKETSLALPCLNLSSFRSKCTALKKVIVTLLGFFGNPIMIRHLGNCAPLSPSLCLCTKRNNKKNLQFWRVVNSIKTWKKEWFGIQARGPQMCKAPGICPICPMVNLALAGPCFSVCSFSVLLMYANSCLPCDVLSIISFLLCVL